MHSNEKLSKLAHFLKVHIEKRHKQFLVFLDSPYFNQKSILQDLYFAFWDSKKRCISEPSELDQYRFIFPNKVFNQNRLRKLKTELLTLVHEFIAIEKAQQNQVNKDLALLREMNERGDFRYFDTYYSRFQGKVESADEELNSLFHLGLERQKSLIQRESPHASQQLRQLRSQLDLIFTDKWIRLSLFQKIHPHHKSQIGDFVSPLKSLTTSSWLKVRLLPATNLYYLLLKLFHTEHPSHFLKEFKSTLASWKNRKNDSSCRDIVNGLTCFFKQDIKICKGQKLRFLQEIHELFLPFYLKEPRLPYSEESLRFMIQLGGELDQPDWILPLICSPEKRGVRHSYSQKLEVFCKMIVFFHKKDYQSSETLLHQLMGLPRSPYFELTYRTYLLIIYFEQGHIHGIDSLAHSTRIFLRENKNLSDKERLIFSDFIRMYNKLTRLKMGENAKVQRFLYEINSLPHISMQGWFREKGLQLYRNSSRRISNQHGFILPT